MTVRRWIEAQAKQIRSRYVKKSPASLEVSYSAAFFLARRIHWRVRDVTIMVGDYNHGMHHWLESKRLGIFIDPAADEGVQIAELNSAAYTENYFRAQDSLFRVHVSRDHPRYVYSPATAEAPESP
jgi:hypothetical protein